MSSNDVRWQIAILNNRRTNLNLSEKTRKSILNCTNKINNRPQEVKEYYGIYKQPAIRNYRWSAIINWQFGELLTVCEQVSDKQKKEKTLENGENNRREGRLTANLVSFRRWYGLQRFFIQMWSSRLRISKRKCQRLRSIGAAV